jgi:hypothetical protein
MERSSLNSLRRDKAKLTSIPVLNPPSPVPSKSLSRTYDASASAAGAPLSLKLDGHAHPIEIYSRKLSESIIESKDKSEKLIKREHKKDSYFGGLWTALAEGKISPTLENRVQKYLIRDSLIFKVKDGTLCIPKNEKIIKTIIYNNHCSAVAGHFGLNKTYVLI